MASRLRGVEQKKKHLNSEINNQIISFVTFTSASERSMNFFFPPHSRVQSCSILRGVARAHRVGVVPNCTMGLFWETLSLLSLAIKKVHRKVGQNLYLQYKSHSTIRPITEPVLSAISNVKTNKWASVGTSLPPMLILHRWTLCKGQNTNTRVRVVCDEPTPYFRLLQSILYYLSPPLLGKKVIKPTPPLTSLPRSSMIYSPDLRTRSYDFFYLRLHDRPLHVLELFNFAF